jgi:hypothetical protein
LNRQPDVLAKLLTAKESGVKVTTRAAKAIAESETPSDSDGGTNPSKDEAMKPKGKKDQNEILEFMIAGRNSRGGRKKEDIELLIAYQSFILGVAEESQLRRINVFIPSSQLVDRWNESE